MAATWSDGGPQILRAVGPSLPVAISLDAQQSTLPPGVFVVTSDDADLSARVEASFDVPDATGALPSPGNWVPYEDFGTAQGYVSGPSDARAGDKRTRSGKLKMVVSAIRLNVLSYAAGSVTFGVTQARVPHSRDATF